MILAQANYGVTISSEGITIIVVLLVVGIVTIWLRSFIAKPDTLSSELNAFKVEVNKRFNDHEMRMKDLSNEIERNSEKDIEERKRHSDTIAKIELYFWDLIKSAIKK